MVNFCFIERMDEEDAGEDDSSIAGTSKRSPAPAERLGNNFIRFGRAQGFFPTLPELHRRLARSRSDLKSNFIRFG